MLELLRVGGKGLVELVPQGEGILFATCELKREYGSEIAVCSFLELEAILIQVGVDAGDPTIRTKSRKGPEGEAIQSRPQNDVLFKRGPAGRFKREE